MNFLPEVKTEKAELISERLEEAIIDYSDENLDGQQFPLKSQFWHRNYSGYSVTLEGERTLQDAFAVYEDETGVFHMVYEYGVGIIGSPVMTTMK